jgi:polar amino acid transport system permease protein
MIERDASGGAAGLSTTPSRARKYWDLAQFAALVAGVIWLVYAGAHAMNYKWQWHRVPNYLWRVIDGELLPGPLLKGLVVTLEISALSFALTLAVGLGAALLRLSDSHAGRALARGYVELIRNTPLLVQIYVVYFVLAPILGIDRYLTAVLCLGLFEGSFAAEIIRAGILAVPKGQWEAAASIGLSRYRLYRHVVLPQAARLMLPPLTSLAVSLIKHSAIVSVIAVFDLTNEGRNIIADTFMTFEIWLIVAAIYLVITTTLSALVGRLERRFEAGTVTAAAH